MKIKLLNGTEYEIVSVQDVSGVLHIAFSGKTQQELEKIFKDKTQLGVIEVYDGSKLVSRLDGFVVYNGQTYLDTVNTVLLSHEVDLSEQRITQAVSNALMAISIANSADTKLESVDSKVDYVAMMANADVTTI